METTWIAAQVQEPFQATAEQWEHLSFKVQPSETVETMQRPAPLFLLLTLQHLHQSEICLLDSG